jgi:FlaG/FlaF family flagellin (archaellin)
MSLRSFHLFFIAISVVLAAFVAAWATGQYRAAHEASYALGGAASMAAAVGLAVYANAFRRKTKQL